jgi:chromosome segregation ATPase
VQIIQSASLENATLEERLANAEQGNSILRLRLMKKDELLASAQLAMGEQESILISLEQENLALQSSLQQSQVELGVANQEINMTTARLSDMAQQITQLNQLLAQQQQAGDEARAQLASARLEIYALSESSSQQQNIISQLSKEKSQLSADSTATNRQLLTLKSEYDLVKSQYEDLIKPARSAKGKHIAEVYYIKENSGIIIRYRQPGDAGFSRLSLAEVESRLEILKREYGDQLYIKIIIPEDSGLSYNEAWEFMRKLLAKYDYYYQE